MNRIRNWSLLTKLSFPYYLVVTILVINVVSTFAHLSKFENYVEVVNLVGKMRMYSQKAGFTAELITNSNKNIYSQLDKEIKFIDKSLKVFEEGGYVNGYENSFSPLPSDMKYILKEVSEYWQPLKENYTKISTTQIITHNVEYVTALRDSTEQSISTSKIETELPPELVDAMEYIEVHSNEFLGELNQLANGILSLRQKNKNRIIVLTFVLFFVNLLIIIMGILFGRKAIINPVKYLAGKTKDISTGALKVDIEMPCGAAIGDQANSLIKLRNNLSEKTEFVNEISSGNYENSFKLQNEEDILGLSLLNLKDNLIKKAKEEQERNDNEAKQNWLTKKLADFADILRKDNDNIEQFAFNLVQYIVNSLEANQGGLFLINEDVKEDIHIELIASLAFDKRKFLQKRIEIGEGLVGRVLQEKKPIYMKYVPEDYVHITSGLGGARPRNIVLVPLLVAENVFGVVEIASFNELEEYQLEFLYKAAESIASTIASVKTSIRTSKLLAESQEQRQVLAVKEAEMLNNMKELQTVQEEAKIQEQALSAFTDSVNNTLIRAEYSLEGELIYANKKFLQKLEYNKDIDVLNTDVYSFVHETEHPRLRQIWAALKSGQVFEGRMKHLTRAGNEIWLIATFSGVKKANGKIEKFLFLGIDTTEDEIRNLDYRSQLNALNLSYLKLEISTNGQLLYFNEIFENLVNFTKEQLAAKVIFDLIARDNLSEFKEEWEKVLERNIFQGEIKVNTASKIKKWVNVTIAPVYDIYENVSKIIILGNDITKNKNLELKAIEDSKQIIEQKEEMSQNLEEVNVIREQLEFSNEEAEAKNKILEENEAILKAKLEKSLQKEKEITEKTVNLEHRQEELKQNMEELQSTQKKLEKEKASIEKENKKNIEEIEKKLNEQTLKVQEKTDYINKLEKELIDLKLEKAELLLKINNSKKDNK